jgi:tRNA-dihydrouridine synthase
MITVHGRTRCQFYGGRADWSAIRRVKNAVAIPVVANGDCVTVADARAMLAASGADGLMIGRGSYGRPWWPAVVAEALEPGGGCREPSLAEQASLARRHHDGILCLYGHEHGNRVARNILAGLSNESAKRGIFHPTMPSAGEDGWSATTTIGESRPRSSNSSWRFKGSKRKPHEPILDVKRCGVCGPRSRGCL